MLPGLSRLLAIILVGILIKLMDDYLDYADEADNESLGGILLSRISRGVLPYLLIILILGLYLDFTLTSALFLSAYSVGMTGQGLRLLPSGATNIAESILAILLGGLIAGPGLMTLSLAAITAVQAADDLLDAKIDGLRGSRSWYYRFGARETLIIFILALFLGAFFNLVLLIEILAISRLIAYLFDRKL